MTYASMLYKVIVVDVSSKNTNFNTNKKKSREKVYIKSIRDEVQLKKN